jgi:hypothetical protein
MVAILTTISYPLGAFAQQQVVTGSAANIGQTYGTAPPSPITGAGAPNSGCSSSINPGNLYIQSDATPGQRIWVCDQTSGTWSWDNLKGAIAIANTSPITASTLLA